MLRTLDPRVALAQCQGTHRPESMAAADLGERRPIRPPRVVLLGPPHCRILRTSWEFLTILAPRNILTWAQEEPGKGWIPGKIQAPIVEFLLRAKNFTRISLNRQSLLFFQGSKWNYGTMGTMTACDWVLPWRQYRWVSQNVAVQEEKGT